MTLFPYTTLFRSTSPHPLRLYHVVHSTIRQYQIWYFLDKGPSFASYSFSFCFVFCRLTTGLALIFFTWATVTEGLHLSRNVHHNLDTTCPTAKTGLFGGAGFIALDATLFWLVCQMLTLNARADYFDEDEDAKGHYGQVYETDYDAINAPNKAWENGWFINKWWGVSIPVL